MSQPHSKGGAQLTSTPLQRLLSRVSYLLLAIILGVILSELASDSWHGEGPSGSSATRGTLVSLLIIAALIAALLRRQKVQFLPLDAVPRMAIEVHLVEWFVWMRWVASATATILTLITVDVAGLLPSETFLPLMLCVAGLAAANICFEIALHKFPRQVDTQIWAQVICDLAILSLMLHFSGGIENPLSLLFLFHVIISGILFSKSRCYLVSLLALVFFSTLVLLELWDWVGHYTLLIFPHGHEESTSHAAHHGIYVYSKILLQALLLVTTAYFITTIMDRLRGRERELIELAKKETEARQRLESVVDAAGVGLRLLDRQLEPVWTNSRFLAWSMNQDAVLSNAIQTLEDGSSRSVDHEIEHDGNQKCFYRTTTAAMTPGHGIAHQVVLLIQDISAQKRAESELLFAGKLAAVGELAGNISHEINNPLGILSARLHLLLSRHSHELSEVVHREVDKMTHMADRITTITRALLDYCRPGIGERKDVSLTPIVERAVSVGLAHIGNQRLSIETKMEEELPLLNANSGELEQVLVNLLMNAVDASPPGSQVLLEVKRIANTGERSRVHIVVQDSGTGIKESVQSRIFEPFFTTKKAGSGTGLGLSICHRIITSHAGTISMRNVPGSGARFQIDLPAIPN